jgi:hypothetical protein
VICSVVIAHLSLIAVGSQNDQINRRFEAGRVYRGGWPTSLDCKPDWVLLYANTANGSWTNFCMREFAAANPSALTVEHKEWDWKMERDHQDLAQSMRSKP